MPLARSLDLPALIRGVLLRHTGLWLGAKRPASGQAARFQEYLREELLPRLGLADARLSPVAHGTQAIACKIEPDRAADPPLLARCEPRRKGREKARERRAVSDLIRRAGVDTPELVHADASYLTLGRHRFDVTVEEWIDGAHPEPEAFESDETLARLARLMAALHRETAERPGYAWRRRQPPTPFLGHYFVRRERTALDALRTNDVLSAGEEELRAIGRSLDRHRSALETPMAVSLIHGDLQAQNLLARADGSAPGAGGFALIDFDTAHYGLWPWEVVVFHDSVHEIPDVAERLVAHYLAERPEAKEEEFRRLWPYLHLWYHLRRTAKSLRGGRRARDGREGARSADAFRANARLHWERTREALESSR